MNHQLPRFSNINVQDFPKSFEALLEHNKKKIDELLAINKTYTWDNLVYPLEEMDDALSKQFSPISHLHAVMNSPALRAAYQQCLPMLSAYESFVSHHQGLYRALSTIDMATLNATQQKIMADILRDFKLEGIALPPEKQSRFEAINARLAELSNQFENNVLDAVHAYTLPIAQEEALKGLPAHAVLSAKARAEEKNQPGFELTLETPCYLAVMTYAEDRALRETLYEAYVTRASDQGPHAGQFDNTPIIQEILKLRDEKANLLGFKSYAELSIASKMADTPNEVFSFIQNLLQHVLPKAKQEVIALSEFAQKHCGIAALQPWDISFVSQKKKEAEYALNDEALRPYFPLPHVMKGAFHIIKTLYGMVFEDITASVDIWHPDVNCYVMYDSEKNIRGYLYTDLFARANKRGGAWMDDAQSRRKLKNGQIQAPIALLTCNFAKSTLYHVPTLSHDEVVTLFHELGHCLHHMLTKVDYLSASGIQGVEWDAVELPSQFFENFCWDKTALEHLSTHVETGEPLPKACFDALIASKQFQAGLHLIRQLEFAWFDFLLHDAYPGDDSNWLQNTLNHVRQTTQVLPIAEYHRFPQSFTHLFAGGYAAGYYSYLWAEVLSSDAFSRFENEGIFNTATGIDFLTEILEVGGSRKAAASFEAFRGRPPSIEAFLKHHGIEP